jgi:hypothetical protein
MHREIQERNRHLFSDGYRAELDLIFAAPDGGFLKPASVTRACGRLAKKAGLARAGLQTLRHSHASLLLSNSVPIPVVSKRLGHADTYTTARIYSHALPSDEQAAAEMWEKIRSRQGAKSGGLKERAAGPASPAAPFGTIDSPSKIARMWRFTRSNGITECFHNRMETVTRQAYGFRNFENYWQRVQVLCA